ncbi:hypothetical protein P153DRAFT_433545 [Dothidotthia symphoricarpi CBS 119687]|uniref:Chromosome condensation protein-like protein n=1 Tax=Dothidotthia symphoricarpi CBS 119687 TaxID=1392245 RepID=A0A6A6A5C8_9PLEO|nr:uncharacterized protein P153DRAFT_433545 [Dothidotthia symphoricarpi CBS 119687]KAF2126383.1 hypothetical protein P153DRAFT_433545 [Dothidotthia symphoricarpi CBS 119687]
MAGTREKNHHPPSRSDSDDSNLELPISLRADSDTLPSPGPISPPSQQVTNNAKRKSTSQTPDSLSRNGSRAGGNLEDITALPNMAAADANTIHHADDYVRSRPTPRAQKLSRIATEFYTASYLIFFSIWGTLARLGLQALTFYPGAPVVFSELWANVAGVLIIGFLVEDVRLLREEWGSRLSPTPSQLESPDALPDIGKDETPNQHSKAGHAKAKKTIPLYIGLATGFCGSFTSFSSFIRDVFLALSNDLKSPINHPYPAGTSIPAVTTTVPRNGGYSFLAILATIIITLATCYTAFTIGAHLANLLDPITPTLPFRLTRRILDPTIALLAWVLWLAAILMAIFPPEPAWRSQALFACVFAPLGCLARHYASQRFNPLLTSFPLGTFAVNMLGTAILAMAYDLQRVSLGGGAGVAGGSVVGCQVLQGVEDGFCGALTTVSTWMAEIHSLRRRHAYVYAALELAKSNGCVGLLIRGIGAIYPGS